MTNCTASPPAAIAECVDFLELTAFADFSEFVNMAELVKRVEKD